MSTAVMLIGWIKAIAFNVVSDFKESLDEKYHKMTIGTIVRTFIHRPATIKTIADEIIVTFDHFKEQGALMDYCETINHKKLEISWLINKILKFGSR